MKTLKTIIAAAAIFFGALTVNAQSMSYEAMRSNARFLTDRMAYELGITSMRIIDDIYRINFDYIYGINEYLDEIALGYFYDDYMEVCARRDFALRSLLGDIVWNRIIGYNYFYRPIVFANHRWHFSIYDYDRYGMHHFFYREPRHFHRNYSGGHFFSGMRPAGGHIMHRPTPAPHREGNRPQGAIGNGRPQGGNQHGNMNNNRPQGGNQHNGVNNGRPQGGMNNDRPQGGNNQHGNMNNNRPQGGNPQGNTPQGGMNNNRPQGNDRPQGGASNSNRPQGPQGGGISRGSSMGGRSDNNARSSSRSNAGSPSAPSRGGSSRSNAGSAPSRSGSSGGSMSRSGGSSSGGSRGGSSHGGGGMRGGRR